LVASITFIRRFTAGPRFLVAATTLAIAFGVALMYFREGAHPSYLFFFYLPIAAVSVVLGRMIGLLMALVAVAAVLLPSIWLGLGALVSEAGAKGEKAAIVIVWAIFLMSMAYLVGWVSERGGSLSLTQGLGGKTVRAIELERRRTGQDIHDGIAQYAAAAFIETEVLAELTAEAEPRVITQVERVKQTLDLLVAEARAMVGNLRPPALGPAEFSSSLSSLVEGFQKRTGVACDLELEGDFALHSDSVRICVYRTAQEALTNVERHSGATAVHVWARAGKGGVDLIVRDNGKGFDPEAAPPVDALHHFGLSGMRERAGYLGGRLTVKSAPGEGTSVVLHVPRYEAGRNDRA
jgi:signal transduction histidine kinase